MKALTEVQIQKIYECGQICHKGLLEMGYNKMFVSAARFKATDKEMIFNYFKL